jgi:ACS family glucarate transporter-like MFS transporter
VSFFITGALGFVWLIFWLTWYQIPERAKWLRPNERQKILTDRDAGTDQIAAQDDIGVVALLRYPSMWAVSFIQGCGVYSHYFLLTWLPSYLATSRGLTVLNTGLYVLIPYAAATVFALVLARISDKVFSAKQLLTGSRRIIVVVTLLASSSILFAPLVSSIAAIMAMITLSISANAVALSMNHAMTNDLLRVPSSAGKAFGLLATGGNLFGMLAPIVTGYVVSATGGYVLAFQIAGALLASGAVVAFFFTRTNIGTRLTEIQPVKC